MTTPFTPIALVIAFGSLWLISTFGWLVCATRLRRTRTTRRLKVFDAPTAEYPRVVSSEPSWLEAWL